MTRPSGRWAVRSRRCGSALSSSAARSRTSTRTRCASACSPTATPSAAPARTSPSSTRAASRTRRSRSRRKAAARAARTHRRVYVTGCAANLAADAFAGLPANVVVVARRSEETPAFVAGDVGAIGCVQADARLDRVRAFVKVQDGCSFSCALLRDPARPRRVAQPQRRRRARRDPPPRRAGPPRGRPHGHQPRLLPRPRRRLRPAAARARGRARRRDSSGSASRSIEINHVDDELVAALRETPDRAAATCTSRSSPATTACCARWAAATRSRRTCAGSSRSQDEFNLTSDVIVGFPAEDERAFAQHAAHGARPPG